MGSERDGCSLILPSASILADKELHPSGISPTVTFAQGPSPAPLEAGASGCITEFMLST
jgi:hypothetical protein